MGTAKAHYDNHLGNFYSWMMGDFGAMVGRQKEEFADAGITDVDAAVAWDLGAGNGVQTVALCDMGYKVTAIDFNKQLLEELRANTVGREVHIIKDDLLVGYKLDISPSLVVCCGDTIAHLPDYIKYMYESPVPQATIFSEIYYEEGWNAYLDGNKIDYFRVNYLLRGMIIPEGDHTIEFKFEPQTYATSNVMSSVFSIIVLLLLVLSLIRYNKNKDGERAALASDQSEN